LLYYKTGLCVLLAGLAAILCSCMRATVSDIPIRNWKLSVGTGGDAAWTRGAQMFADLVKQRSGGRMQITVYPNAMLAGGNQLNELTMLRDGNIDFTYHSTLLYSNLDQSFAAVSMPWLFTDYAQVDAVLFGEAGSELLKETRDYGVVGLAFGENGFRQLTNSRLAVRTPDDLHGLKIRIPDVALYNSIFRQLGATPVMMNFPDVTEALKQGRIDGQENPVDIIVSSKLYEVQNHITVWNYSYEALILGMNKKAWDGLPASAQNIIRQAAIEASMEQVRLSREAARTKLDLLRDQGMTVTELTPDQMQSFRAATEPVYKEWSAKIEPGIQKLWDIRKIE